MLIGSDDFYFIGPVAEMNEGETKPLIIAIKLNRGRDLKIKIEIRANHDCRIPQNYYEPGGEFCKHFHTCRFFCSNLDYWKQLATIFKNKENPIFKDFDDVIQNQNFC